MFLGLEDKICQLENEKSRLQNVCREVEFKLLQSNQNSQTLQQELEKSNSANLQKQNDEKELLTKLNVELEDKEKLQQELHVYKKQVLMTRFIHFGCNQVRTSLCFLRIVCNAVGVKKDVY